MRVMSRQSRASSRASQLQLLHDPGAANVGPAEKEASRYSQQSSRHQTLAIKTPSSNPGTMSTSKFDGFSIAAGTASSDTGNMSDAANARIYLRNNLSATAQQTTLALRVATDAHTAVISRKFMTRSINAAMEGVQIMFRGPRGADTLHAWQRVTADDITVNTHKKKAPKMKVDVTGYTHLAYIDRGKTETLVEISTRQAQQEQVLATARCFGMLIEHLDVLSSGGAPQRARIVALGGAQLLVSACRFIRDEDLLLKCLLSIFRLSHDFAHRRQLVRDDVRAPETLAAVLCRPHIPEVVAITHNTLNLINPKP